MALNHRDQDVVDLYHTGASAEPPERLDEAILAAAREAVAPRRRESGLWSRLFQPLRLVASFALAAVVGLLVVREALPPRPLEQLATPAAPPAASLSDAAKPASAPRKKTTEPARESTLQIPAPPTAQNSTPTPVARPAQETATATREASPAIGAAAPQPAARAMSKQEKVANDASLVNVPAKTAKDWADEITALLDRGKIDEARSTAEAYRKAFPEQPLPEIIRKRLES